MVKRVRQKDQKIHLEQVQALQQVLREKKGSFSLSKNPSSNTLRRGGYKDDSHNLDLSSFTGWLDFKPQEHQITVEPRVTFGALCHFTLKHGLIPPVVPEFPAITVGGAVLGAALESSSHRYGQVSDNCLEYEVILGDGEKVKASLLENTDLFFALAGSYGTLGVLTAVTLKLIPAKPYVHLSYHRYEKASDALQKLSSSHVTDYLEGIVYSPDAAVVIEGRMVEQPKGKLFRHHFFWSKWFAQHVHHQTLDESMPIADYLFRHNRGAFWIGKYILALPTLMRLLLHLGIPEINRGASYPNLFYRLLFGWIFSSERLYRIWHRVPKHISEKIFFIHDFYTPVSKADEALAHFMKATSIFPIWLCPIKGGGERSFLSPHYGKGPFLNIGLYGMPAGIPSIPDLTAQLEQDIVSLGGRKMLYSFTYYDKKNFDALYQGELYTELRKKFHAETAFPSLYQKVTNQ